MAQQTLSNAELITQYQVARETVITATAQFGIRSQEHYDAMTTVLALEDEVIKRGLTREAGIKFANVWD